MDGRINPDRETFRSALRRIPFRNQAIEDAPPFAVVVMGPDTLAPDGSWCLTATKPESGVRAVMVAANSSVRCDVDTVGELTIDAPVVFRVSGASVAAGDVLGPVADSWDMQATGSGWRAITDETLRHGIRTVMAVLDSSAGRKKYWGVTTSTFAAASGVNPRTLGSGTVQAYQTSGTTGTPYTDVIHNVLNPFPQSVPVGYWVQYEQIDPEGFYQITAVGCPAP